FRARRIDDGAARHLPDQPDDAADRQHQADLRLRPLLRGQIHRDERAKTGLHVGEEENEPVEPAQALFGRVRLAGGTGWDRRNLAVADRRALTITIAPLTRVKWPRCQNAPPLVLFERCKI